MRKEERREIIIRFQLVATACAMRKEIANQNAIKIEFLKREIGCKLMSRISIESDRRFEDRKGMGTCERFSRNLKRKVRILSLKI